MKEYIISISDDRKANQLLAFLRDLSYVKIHDTQESTYDSEQKKYPLMDNPFHVENFKRYSREELYDR